jgi:hypothetical protein
MPNITELLDRSRRRMLMGLLSALIAWVALRIWGVLGASESGAVDLTLTGLLILGGAVWLLYLVRMIGYAHAARADRSLLDALYDERVRANRRRAFSFGFVAVLVSQLVMLVASIGADLPVGLVVNLTLAVAIASAIGAFLVYDRG